MLVLVIALGISSIGVNALHAATQTGTFHPMTNLVNAIAEKFSLNPSEVQAVFDAEKIKAEAQRESTYESNISTAVAEGNLTQTQADLIIDKHKVIEAERQNFENSDNDETSNMKNQIDSLRSWAQENNIPIQYLYFGPKEHMYGMGMGKGMYDDNDEDD